MTAFHLGFLKLIKKLNQFIDQGNYNQSRFDKLKMRSFDDSNKLRILVVGDSYAKDVVNVMYEGQMDQFIQFSTKQINSECGNSFTNKNIEKFIPQKRSRRCETIGRYEDPQLQILMSQADEIWLVSSWKDWVVDLIPETLASLSANSDAKLRVFGTKNFGTISPESILKIKPSKRRYYMQESSASVALINQRLREIIPEDIFVDLGNISCGEKGTSMCRIFTEDGLLISADGGHLTKEGAKYLSQDLLKHLKFSSTQ
jgi:hypothetical protein